MASNLSVNVHVDPATPVRHRVFPGRSGFVAVEIGDAAVMVHEVADLDRLAAVIAAARTELAAALAVEAA